MPTILEIEDGNPWWLSHDIWVVPGNDPNGMPGQPVSGEPAFLWARIHNKGEQAVAGACIKYYWSNPATGVLRSNSSEIGSAFVDLNPGETKEVLCIIPWIPVIVNDGHECVVAEVIHSSDPLPGPLPDPFDPPNYHQVAQRNLNVLAMKARKMRVLPIQLATPIRRAKQLLIKVEVGGQIDDRLLAPMNLREFIPADGENLKVGLSLDSSCGDENEQFEREIKVGLNPGTARAVYLKVFPAELEPRTYTLLHITSQSDEKIEGGITYVVVNQEEI